ncbi:hypothetical protein BSNK01_06840 [Bacillaceae bacterium]
MVKLVEKKQAKFNLNKKEKMKEIVKLAIEGALREKFRELAPADVKNGQFVKGYTLHSLSSVMMATNEKCILLLLYGVLIELLSDFDVGPHILWFLASFFRLFRVIIPSIFNILV